MRPRGGTAATGQEARITEAHNRADEALHLIVRGIFSDTGSQFLSALVGQLGAALEGGLRQREEEILSLIAAGTSSSAGEGSFRALTRQLAASLRVRFAFLAEVVDPAAKRFRTLSFWNDSDYGENRTYPMKGSPCLELVAERFVYHPARVRELFPNDLWLREVGAEGYVAICLADSSDIPLGFLGAMHDERMDAHVPTEPILRIFAAQASVELQYSRAKQALQEKDAITRALCRVMPNLMIRVRRDGIILDLIGESGEDLALRSEQLIARKIQAVLPAQLGQQCMHHMELALQSGSAQRFTYQPSDLGDGRSLDVRIAVSGEEEVVIVLIDQADRGQLAKKVQGPDNESERVPDYLAVNGERYRLTDRELSVLELVASGKTNKAIALQLGIAVSTVHKHVVHILHKMQAASRTEAGVRATREGLLSGLGV